MTGQPYLPGFHVNDSHTCQDFISTLAIPGFLICMIYTAPLLRNFSYGYTNIFLPKIFWIVIQRHMDFFVCNITIFYRNGENKLKK